MTECDNRAESLPSAYTKNTDGSARHKSSDSTFSHFRDCDGKFERSHSLNVVFALEWHSKIRAVRNSGREFDAALSPLTGVGGGSRSEVRECLDVRLNREERETVNRSEGPLIAIP